MSTAEANNGSTVSGQEQERRAKKRYPVSTLAQFRWQDSTGTWISGTGVTQDISVAGVYILTSVGPDVGSLVEVTVATSLFGNASGRARLHGKGVVKRVNLKVGFAAEINHQVFRLQHVGSENKAE